MIAAVNGEPTVKRFGEGWEPGGAARRDPQYAPRYILEGMSCWFGAWCATAWCHGMADRAIA